MDLKHNSYTLHMKIYYPYVRTHIKLLWDSSVPQLGNTFAFLHHEVSFLIRLKKFRGIMQLIYAFNCI